jgi:hypothetical protein
MKSLREYIVETEATAHTPRVGDGFAIEFGDDCLIESHVVDVMDDGIVIAGDAQAIKMLESYGCKMETIRRYGAVGSNRAMGYTLEEGPNEETGLSRIKKLAGVNETAPYEPEQNAAHNDPLAAKAADLAQVGALEEDEVDEAKYQGREVQLNKPMAGDVKKSKVYVRDPATGNIKKVNFGHGGTSAKRAGQKTMKIKKSNPDRRRSFRARHNCDNPGPKTKARYWSCRAW